MERYCPLVAARFVPFMKFRRTPSGCTKVFFRKLFFLDNKNIFCAFSVGMQLEIGKTESVNDNESKENKDVDEFQEYILQTGKHKSKSTK